MYNIHEHKFIYFSPSNLLDKLDQENLIPYKEAMEIAFKVHKQIPEFDLIRFDTYPPLNSEKDGFRQDWIDKHQNSLILISTISGEPVGYAVAGEFNEKRESDFFKSKPTEEFIYIDMVGVVPSSRRQGIMKKYLQLIEDEAKKRGKKYITFRTWANKEVMRAFGDTYFRLVDVIEKNDPSENRYDYVRKVTYKI